MVRFLFSIFLILIMGSFSVSKERAFSVSDIGSSAKFIGLGGIELSTSSAASIFHNPSLLQGNYMYSISAFTTQLFNEVNYRNLAISKQFKNFNIAMGYMDASVSDIPITTKLTDSTGTYFDINGYYNLRFSLYKMALSYQLTKRFILGAGVSYIDNSISDVSATGFNADLGLNYKYKNNSFSLSIDNIFQNYDLDYSNDGQESYPLKVTFSCLKNLAFLTPMIQYSLVQDYLPQFAIGMELKHPKFSYLDGFLGYKSDYYLDDYDYKLTLGLGLNFFGVSFHYAYQKSDYIQTDNYSFFSMMIKI